MIALRNDFAAYSRRADARIGLLKEIIERIQKGEEVDVEGLLGTGDAVREQEWEEGKNSYFSLLRMVLTGDSSTRNRAGRPGLEGITEEQTKTWTKP